MGSMAMPTAAIKATDEGEMEYPDEHGFGSGTKTLTRPKDKLKKPSMFKVVLLNDDYTPMDFVVHILIKFFKKSENGANSVMLQVHQQGAGLCGIYPHEIAETKVFQVNEYSRNHKHPLKCIMEEVENSN